MPLSPMPVSVSEYVTTTSSVLVQYYFSTSSVLAQYCPSLRVCRQEWASAVGTFLALAALCVLSLCLYVLSLSMWVCVCLFSLSPSPILSCSPSAHLLPYSSLILPPSLPYSQPILSHSFMLTFSTFSQKKHPYNNKKTPKFDLNLARTSSSIEVVKRLQPVSNLMLTPY